MSPSQAANISLLRLIIDSRNNATHVFSMRAQLIPLDSGPPFEVTKDLILVGRRADCDFRLEHRGISKIHCVLVRTDGLLLLRDLGSTNGTQVNGERVRRAMLLPNDRLTLAGVNFRVHLGPGETPPETVTTLDPARVAELRRRQQALDAEAGETWVEIPPIVRDLPDVAPGQKL
jgi:pSer/pThr/pTyr-binding forkhead associated (FHA) protein